MAINADVMEFIRILDEEEFGWLAGELLSEISLGRERDGAPDQKAYREVDGDENDGDAELVAREPIPDGEQLRAAVEIMRLRLVAPARALAEAENIAAALTDREGRRIAFVEADGAPDERIMTEARPGDASIADKLDEVLGRILDTPRTLEV